MPRVQQTYHPELPFYSTETPVQVKKQTRRTERATDSEGRFACEGTFPNRQTAEQTEIRRQQSVAVMLRLKDEEINQLRAQLKKYQCND
jgi:hypothetical protein